MKKNYKKIGKIIGIILLVPVGLFGLAIVALFLTYISTAVRDGYYLSKVFPDAQESQYVVSKRKAFYVRREGGSPLNLYLQKLRRVDIKSLEIINNSYAKDKNFVYQFNKRIQGADPDTFVVPE
ncbi:MAG: DKNYY domain-containing protein [Candidatus Nomurabacteria bacterium]|nr:DKNYY domain-containing protein [Candidatus Nomurabacteria bacterium]